MRRTKVVCILPNVNTVAKKRRDEFQQEVRDSGGTQSIFDDQKERSTDPIPSLHLPTQNECVCPANHIPLLDLENGRALTILPGMCFYD